MLAATRSRRSPGTALVLAGLALLALCPAGCVRRRMTIRTDPPGAVVKVDHHEIGRTPVSAPFVYYGTRQVQLVKDGYETLTVQQPIGLPWYQIPPLDFITENLLPWEIRDEREFQFAMQPTRNVPTEELMGRAEQLRGDLQTGNIPPQSPGAGIIPQGYPAGAYATPPATAGGAVYGQPPGSGPAVGQPPPIPPPGTILPGPGPYPLPPAGASPGPELYPPLPRIPQHGQAY